MKYLILFLLLLPLVVAEETPRTNPVMEINSTVFGMMIQRFGTSNASIQNAKQEYQINVTATKYREPVVLCTLNGSCWINTFYRLQYIKTDKRLDNNTEPFVYLYDWCEVYPHSVTHDCSNYSGYDNLKINESFTWGEYRTGRKRNGDFLNNSSFLSTINISNFSNNSKFSSQVCIKDASSPTVYIPKSQRNKTIGLIINKSEPYLYLPEGCKLRWSLGWDKVKCK